METAMLRHYLEPRTPFGKLRPESHEHIFVSSQAAHLAIRLGHRYRNGFGMDIQPQKSYLSLHDRFLSALWL